MYLLSEEQKEKKRQKELAEQQERQNQKLWQLVRAARRACRCSQCRGGKERLTLEGGASRDQRSALNAPFRKEMGAPYPLSCLAPTLLRWLLENKEGER